MDTTGHYCALARMKCPGSNNPLAGKGKWCPAWVEVEQRAEEGEPVTVAKACALQLIPDMLIQSHKIALLGANSADQARNSAEMIGEGVMALVTAAARKALPE